MIKGDVPSPIDLPAGCRFHPRCPLKKTICSEEEPPLKEFGPRHWAACHYADER